MIASSYRETFEALLRRRDELIAHRDREALEVCAAPEVFHARVGRIAFGATLTLAFVAMGIAVFGDAWRSSYDETAMLILVLSWPTAAFVWFVARFVAASSQGGRAPLFETSDDVRADIARLESASIAEGVCARIGKLEAWSVALPIIGISLMLPLSLHGLIAASSSARGYAQYIAVSLALVGHAHLVIAITAIAFAVRMSRLPAYKLPELGRRHGFWAYGLAVLCGALPGAVFLLIPPIFVAITGILFVPWQFTTLAGWVRRERAALGVG